MNRPRFSWPFETPGGDEPGQVSPRQPAPILTRVCRMKVAGHWVTCIARTWLFGDSKRCRLCDRCSASGSECVLLIGGFVADRDAPMFRAPRVGHGDGGQKR